MPVITARTIGSKRPLFADWSIPLGPEWGEEGEDLTLRMLIEKLVRVEVESFKKGAAERRLDRVLSPRQIEEGLERGRISPEGRSVPRRVNMDEAIGAALEAFEDGLYLVVIDEEEYKDLDRVVRLRPDSRIVFIRLTFLAGA
ncbi:MAG: hypothetical protein KF838_13625 [Phycisphaeraceae bacterium]|nr:MAG: hypothetical protein KF838_13625 [Phycisphaeraceae bacterium]